MAFHKKIFKKKKFCLLNFRDCYCQISIHFSDLFQVKNFCQQLTNQNVLKCLRILLQFFLGCFCYCICPKHSLLHSSCLITLMSISHLFFYIYILSHFLLFLLLLSCFLPNVTSFLHKECKKNYHLSLLQHLQSLSNLTWSYTLPHWHFPRLRIPDKYHF